MAKWLCFPFFVVHSLQAAVVLAVVKVTDVPLMMAGVLPLTSDLIHLYHMLPLSSQ